MKRIAALLAAVAVANLVMLLSPGSALAFRGCTDNECDWICTAPGPSGQECSCESIPFGRGCLD
jgi:hypothetical protein